MSEMIIIDIVKRTGKQSIRSAIEPGQTIDIGEVAPGDVVICATGFSSASFTMTTGSIVEKDGDETDSQQSL